MSDFYGNPENHEIRDFGHSGMSPGPGTMSETMCVVGLLVSEIFFHEKYIFCTLHYSTGVIESSLILGIINFHEKV